MKKEEIKDIEKKKKSTNSDNENVENKDAEEQAASPLALPWCADCCNSPDIQWVPAWSVPWIEIPANTATHS